MIPFTGETDFWALQVLILNVLILWQYTMMLTLRYQALF